MEEGLLQSMEGCDEDKEFMDKMGCFPAQSALVYQKQGVGKVICFVLVL
jgi:hypothetical protein